MLYCWENCVKFNACFFIQICPIGIPGILYIAGRGVAKGYLGDLRKTRCSFLDNLFGEGSIYCTGKLSVGSVKLFSSYSIDLCLLLPLCV